MQRLLQRLDADLKPMLDRQGWEANWTAEAYAAEDGLRLPVRVRDDQSVLFRVVLQAKDPTRAGGCYAQTARFCLFYGLDRDVKARDRRALEAVMDTIATTVREVEILLDDRAMRATFVVQPNQQPDGCGVLEAGGGRTGETILRITTACNQRCPFCFVRLDSGQLGLGDIDSALHHASVGKPRGTVLTISGGEPTVDPRLTDIMRSARALGLRLELQTNAVRLADERLAGQIVAIDELSCFVSFHAHRSDLYDRITGTSGQFAQAEKGLGNLLASGVHVTVNCVVNRLNCGVLDEYVGYLAKLRKQRQLAVFFTFMNGTGHARAPELAIPLSTIGPALDRALGQCSRVGIDVAPMVGDCAVPPCVLREPERYVGQQVMPGAGIRYLEQTSGGMIGGGRVKLAGCRTCSYDDRCMGVPMEHAGRFGLGTLHPVIAKEP